MTDRLYYRDSDLLDFEGSILSIEKAGNRWHTVLDRTAFYPTSGGQLFDTGTIHDVPVEEVLEGDGEQIVHVCADAPGKVGESVRGIVDSDRRRRHRQSHTAQHLLSQAFVQLYDCDTVSVHLGEDYSAIELAGINLPDDAPAKAAELANRHVEENLPVDIRFVSEKEIPSLPLRKPSQRTGTLRVIKIGDIDWSACGGTHCTATGQIRLIQTIGSDRTRGHLLVKFLAGDLALKDYRQRLRATTEVVRLLTCGVADMPTGVAKLLAETKSARTEISALRKALLPYQIQDLAGSAKTVGSVRIVAQAVDGLAEDQLSPLALGVAKNIGGLAVLHFGTTLVVAVGGNSRLDAGDMVRRIVSTTGHRGGGGKTVAQIGQVSREAFEKLSAKFLEIASDE